MSQPQNLPELLQARLKLGLVNWARRTLIWTGVLGLLLARLVARRLTTRGELAPHFLRRARPNETCGGSTP